MTVSNAYNRPDQLSSALRERVLITARKMGYAGPDPMGSGLRRGRAGAIGVLYDSRFSFAFDNPEAMAFLQGVTAATEEENLGLLLVPRSAPGRADAGYDTTASSGAVVDGFLAYSVAHNDPMLQVALERGVPVVTVDQPELDGVSFVGIDDTAAARAAAVHLVGLGHRRFGILSLRLKPEATGGLVGLESRSEGAYQLSYRRIEGYLSALSEAGVSRDSVTVYESLASGGSSGEMAAEELLSSAGRPTALLAADDRLALGAISAAVRRGVSVPKELSVVGFGDSSTAPEIGPSLTTVHQDHEEKGFLAGKVLISEIEGRERPAPTLLPTRLVVRESTDVATKAG